MTSRNYKAKTGVGCHGFHPRVPLDFDTRNQRRNCGNLGEGGAKWQVVATSLHRASEVAEEVTKKLQSLRDKQRNRLKTARDSEEEMQTLNKEWEERKTHYETRVRALSKVGRLSESGSRVGK